MENANSESYQHLLKIVLVGDIRVGKTHIVRRYATNSLPKNDVPTIGVEFVTKTVPLDNNTTIKAQLWDTAGNQRYRAITAAHYRKAAGAVVVYDITDRSTFSRIRNFIQELREAAPSVAIAIVGNKLDLAKKDPSLRKVTREEAEEMATAENAIFEEVSADTAENVSNMFERLFRSCLFGNEVPKSPQQEEVKEKAKESTTDTAQNVIPTDEILLKMVLVGDSKVGKSNTLLRYTKDTISQNYVPTIGVEFSTKQVTLKDGTRVKGQIWDTAGQERYRSISNAYYRGASGALVLYDITDEKSFDSITRWIEELRNAAVSIVIMLVGNKLDLVEKDPSLRKVSRDVAEQMANDLNILFEEVSAGTGEKINGAFDRLYQEIVSQLNVQKALS